MFAFCTVCGKQVWERMDQLNPQYALCNSCGEWYTEEQWKALDKKFFKLIVEGVDKRNEVCYNIEHNGNFAEGSGERKRLQPV